MFKTVVFIMSYSYIIAACESRSNAVGTGPSIADTTAHPVETKSPNSNYKPAFTGQTRIASMKTSVPYEGRIISKDLKRPWGMVVLPDGRFLITQKAGTMVIATTAGQLSQPITGAPPVNPSGQGGLLDIALDPEFISNRMLYWSFSENTAAGSLTAVAKGRLSNDEKQVENATVIYRATPAFKGNLQYGSRLLFDKTGNIIVSTGERSDPQVRIQAQDLNSGLGKIIRITRDGHPAPGNPFLNRGGARPEVLSYGHRNVEGLAINPVTGDLWETEMGPRGGDELNLIRPGHNYGWPVITYGIEYSGEKVGAGIPQKENMDQPVYYWDPVISPSGITFCSSDNIPEWKNNLFIACLSGTHIARLLIKNNKVVGEERLLADEGERFRDVTQGKDGALYAITDGGRLYRIARK